MASGEDRFAVGEEALLIEGQGCKQYAAAAGRVVARADTTIVDGTEVVVAGHPVIGERTPESAEVEKQRRS